MAPKKPVSDSEEDSTPPSSPPAAVLRKKKFNDEEEDSDSDVLDSWDAEDSEVERKKKAAAEAAAAKKAAEAVKPKKTKAQRIAERKAARDAGEETSEDESEDEEDRRQRLKKAQKEADLKHAEDLFGSLSTGVDARKKAITAQTSSGEIVELGSLPVFKPGNKESFDTLRSQLMQLLIASNKKPLYSSFVQDLVVDLCKELTADQVKKLNSRITAVGNEKMKEEKAQDTTKKKTKAQKTKTTLAGGRNLAASADTSNYADDGLGDDDFM